MELAIKTYDDIMACGPCYDPVERGLCTRDWQGTALDVLRADTISSQDKLWLVVHEGWIGNKTLRLFACWCARQALALIEKPDSRSVWAIEVAERYANGEADDDEMSAAWHAASAAALDARAATRAAAKDAARAAAWDAQNEELERRLNALLNTTSDDFYDDLDE